LQASLKYVIDWIGKKVFGTLPKEEQEAKMLEELVKNFSGWAVEVETLSGEEMLRDVTSSETLSRRCLVLFEKSLQYLVFYLSEKLPQRCAQMYMSLARKAQLLHNMVMRGLGVEEFRITPFHVQLMGKPGIGKSTLIHTIVDSIKRKYFPDRLDNMYSPGKTDHYDGYRGQPIWYIDDMFPANDFKSEIGILTLVSNCPLHLPMAHLEEKQTMFTSDFILSTTNTAYPKFDGMFCQEAIWRRRHLLVNVKVDPAVMNEATGKFDLERFNKKYPNQEANAYPHLTFDFCCPTKENTMMNDEATVAGLVKPLVDLSYSDFINRFFSRYEVQRKEEAQFQTKPRDTKRRRICSLLREFDAVYDEIGSDTSGLYEFNFKAPGNPLPGLRKQVPGDPKYDEASQEFWTSLNQIPEMKTIDLCTMMETVCTRLVELGKMRVFSSLIEFEHAMRDMGVYRITLNKYEEDTEDDDYRAAFDYARVNLSRLYFDFAFEEGIKRAKLTSKDAMKWAKEQLQKAEVNDGVTYNIMAILSGLLVVGGWLDRKNSELGEDVDFVKYIKANFPIMPRPTAAVVITEPLVTTRHTTEELADSIEPIEEAVELAIVSIQKDVSDSNVPMFMLFPASWDENIDVTQINSLLAKRKELTPQVVAKLEMLQVLLLNRISVHQELRDRRLRVKTGRGLLLEDRIEFGSPESEIRPKVFKIGPQMRYVMKVKIGNDIQIHTNPTVSGLGQLRWFDLTDEQKEDWGDRPFPEGMSTAFFTMLRYEEGQWLVDTSMVLDLSAMKVSIFGGLVVCDGSFALGGSKWFRNTAEIFFSLSEADRQKLYKTKYREVTVLRAIMQLGQTMTKKVGKLFKQIWDTITGAATYVWTKCADFKIPVMIGLTALGIIAVCTMFSRLFIPKETSVTSNNIFGRHSNTPRYTADDLVINRHLIEAITEVHINGTRCQGYRMAPKVLLLVHHALGKYKDNDEFQVMFQIKPGAWMTVVGTGRNVVQFGNSDLCLFHHREIPAWKNLTKLMMNERDLEGEMGRMLTLLYMEDGKLGRSTQPYMGRVLNFKANFRSGLSYCAPSMSMYATEVDLGTSGGIVINKRPLAQNPRVILGYQSFTYAGKSYCTNLSYEAFMAEYERVCKMYPSISAPPDYADEEGKCCQETSGLLERNLTLVGTIPAEKVLHIGTETQYRTTPVFEHFDIGRIPAVLSSRHGAACGDPIKNSINKYGRDSMLSIPVGAIEMAVEERVEHYLSQIKRPRVLSTEEAIAGNDLMRHMNMKTSPGIPYVYSRGHVPGKLSIMQMQPDGTVKVDPGFMKDVEMMEEMMKQGKTPPLVMMEVMKDELRPIGKALDLNPAEVDHYYHNRVPYSEWPKDRELKTRSIVVMPATTTVLYRKYFGDFFSQLYGLADGINEYCVGINIESPAAFNLMGRALSLNDQGYDVDVKNWDGHYTAQLAFAVLDVVNGVYNDSDENKTLRHTLVENMLFGFVQYKDLVYQKHTGMVSGFAGTADFNTLGHILLSDCIWMEIMYESGNAHLLALAAKQAKTLDLIYGDDRFIVVSKEIEEFYNGSTIADRYRDYGWPVTSAEKSEVGNSVPLRKMQFLKRTFRQDENDGFYFHPCMDPDTIHNLVCYIRKTNAPRSQFASNVTMALDFAADHGETFYNQFREKLKNALEKECYKLKLETFKTMYLIKKARYFGKENKQRLDNTKFANVMTIDPMDYDYFL